MLLSVANNSGGKYPHDSALITHLDAGNPYSYSGTGSIWNDLSPNGNGSAALTVAPTFISNSQGINYFNFNGTQYDTISNSITTNTLTTFAWLSAGGVQAANTGIVIYRVPAAAQAYIGLMVSSTGAGLQYTWGSNHADLAGSTLPTGQWYMAASTLTPTSYTVYLNANQVATQAATSASTTIPGFAIGYDSYQTSRKWKGNIGLVSIYNRVLSPTEITQYYNTFKGRFGLT